MKTRNLLLTAGSVVAMSIGHQALAQSQDNQVGELVVTGKRVSEASVAIGVDQPTATVSITSEALQSAPAGITGLKMLESLPGFNVQANDALGMYEFGNSVSVRAFNFQQVGFLLDNIPMGRSDQFGGSPIYRYVDNENLERVTASAGAGDVSLPSYSSLGPIVSYINRDPSETFGLTASGTFGADNVKRGFLRLDTGAYGGLSASISGSVISGDLWRGPGDIHRNHYEGRIRYAFNEDADFTFQTVHNDYFDYDSPSITKAQYAGTAGDVFGRSGRNFAYIDFVPVLPETTAGVAYSNTAYNQFYKFAVNSREDHLYGLTLRAPIGPLRLSVTGYYEEKVGWGVSPEAYATSLASYNAQRLILPGLFAPRGVQYGLSSIDGDRQGVTGSVVWEVGAHTLSTGAWTEQDRYHRIQRRFNVANGNPSGAPLLNEVVHRQRDFTSTRDSTQVFIKDTISLLDERLKLDIGAKALNIDYLISGYRNPGDYIASRQPRLTASWKDSFLPQVGAVFSLTDRDQLFASYSENLALPRGADDIFSAASPIVPAPEAEKAKNYEIGIRANRPTFNASLVAYFTTFDNRLQSYASVVPGSATTETFFQNVGAVEAHGAEFSGQWKPGLFDGRLYFNGNLSYNVSKFKDNFAAFTIAGNRVPDFPEWVFQGGVTFEPTDWAAVNLSARSISSRATNFVNTEETDGYTVFNAYVDLAAPDRLGPLQNIKLRFNVDNLFDEDYLGTVSATTNTPATFRPGPHRTFQITLSAAY